LPGLQRALHVRQRKIRIPAVGNSQPIAKEESAKLRDSGYGKCRQIIQTNNFGVLKWLTPK
jgi:hypothetical protein